MINSITNFDPLEKGFFNENRTDVSKKIKMSVEDDDDTYVDVDDDDDDEDLVNEECPPNRRENRNYLEGVTQWSIAGNAFYATRETTKTLPNGFFEIGYDHSLQQYFLRKKTLVKEEIYKLPYPIFDSILEDIKRFWESEEQYKKYNYVFKRGILLYGLPGCGKSSLIQLICDDLIANYNGIIINTCEPDHIYDFDKIVGPLREIEPNRKIIVILEDIDNFVKDRNLLTKLLNMLDGNKKMDNLVILATTNYQEELEERISNRPSRFDRRYEIGKPDEKVRKFYIETKVKPEDLEKLDINKWVKETKDFTLDHLKELVLSVYVLGYSFKDALDEVKTMLKNGKLKPSKPIMSDANIGFKK